jgi:anti-sigma regulatory factor (Ser/Thr protein kinase)
LTNHGERLERSFAYHLARDTWLPSAVVKLRRELSVTAGAAPLARQAIRDEVGARLGEEELDIAEVLATELVTNAVAHAGLGPGDSMVLHLAVAPERIRAEVCDGGVGFDPTEVNRPDGAPGGFGLLMVDRAASRWGVATDDGNCVWFELDRRPA